MGERDESHKLYKEIGFTCWTTGGIGGVLPTVTAAGKSFGLDLGPPPPKGDWGTSTTIDANRLSRNVWGNI